MTPHNEAKKEDIAKIVLMPGDPLRAKYIAENFLVDSKLVNSVRCAYCYTGKYKGKEISVMASGMGMPSMGIYCYELYKVYDVDNIIRIGSCGGYLPELKLFDIILSKRVFSENGFIFHAIFSCPVQQGSQNVHRPEVFLQGFPIVLPEVFIGL